jgi:hypothetical protein
VFGNRVALVVLVVLVGLGTALFLARRDDGAPSKLVLAPLSAQSEIVALAVAGTDGARVSVPLGATDPRPIVIVLHADGERADQYCKIWRGISGGRPFVLCPVLRAQQTDEQVEAALRGALGALKSKFTDYVAGGSVMLAGFGSGAERAMQIARQEPSFFARLVLVDGGHASLSATAAGAYAQRGGQRLLLGCSKDSCRAAIEPKIPVLRSQNLAVELLYAGELSGALDPRMVTLLAERFSWLISNQQPKRVPNPRGLVPE